MEYNVDYFIKKFESVHEENFLVREYGDKNKGCAMGLCSDDGLAHNALYKLGYEYFNPTGDATPIVTINNGNYPEYQQPTAKQRILAALYDIKAKLQPIYKDITKDLAVLPVDEICDQPIKLPLLTPEQ